MIDESEEFRLKRAKAAKLQRNYESNNLGKRRGKSADEYQTMFPSAERVFRDKSNFKNPNQEVRITSPVDNYMKLDQGKVIKKN